MKKVIFNTDIGGDIDDALCLAYLLSQNDCELLGVTTCLGNPVDRAKIADAICRVAGKDVPVYPGLDPKTPNGWYPTADGAAKLPKWDHKKEFEKDKAIDFMYSVLKKYPNEIYIVDAGSFSNIAALFTKYPDSPQLIKELSVMAGVYDDEINNSDEMPFMNWNVWVDPMSARIMFNSNANIKVYGIEITRHLTMTSDELKDQSNTLLLKCALDFGSEWVKDHVATFHDPLLATCLFNDEICEYERGLVAVDLETKSEKKYGMTTFIKNDDGNCLLAVKADRGKFFKEYFGITQN